MSGLGPDRWTVTQGERSLMIKRYRVIARAIGRFWRDIQGMPVMPRVLILLFEPIRLREDER